MFTFTEDAPESVRSIPKVDFKQCLTRQQVPENDTPHVTPPTDFESELKVLVNQSPIINKVKESNENVPVLPSVKKLVSNFQILKTPKTRGRAPKRLEIDNAVRFCLFHLAKKKFQNMTKINFIDTLKQISL